MFKRHYKIGISAHIEEQKIEKMAFLIVTNWATLIVTNWATFAQLKKRQRGPVSSYYIWGPPFFLKKTAENPIFMVFFDKQPFQKNKRGPVSNY